MVSRLAYPDWLILFYLAKCMDKMNFGCLMSNLADEGHGLSYYPVYRDDDSVELEENQTPPPGDPTIPPPPYTVRFWQSLLGQRT